MDDLALRRKRLRHALVEAEITQGQLAKQLGVTESHLIRVLQGERTSPRLDQEIELFIERHTPKHAA